jgi:catechol O-methyltransferase
MTDINWSVKTFPRIALFLASQAIQRQLDRTVSRRPRELDLLEAVRVGSKAGDPFSVLDVMDEFSRNRRWLMSLGPDKGRVLRGLLADPHILRVLEIGTYCGYAATLIGAELKLRRGSLVTLEKHPRNAEVARQVLEHAGLADTVESRNQTLDAAISSLHGPFDLVLLDHWKEQYLPDLQRLEDSSMLRAGSVIVADNVGFFRVPDYLAHVRTSGRYTSRYIESAVEYHPHIPDGIEISTFLS